MHALNNIFRFCNIQIESNKAADSRIVRLFLNLLLLLDISVTVLLSRNYSQRERRLCASIYGLHFPSSIDYEEIDSPDRDLLLQNCRSDFLVLSTRIL